MTRYKVTCCATALESSRWYNSNSDYQPPSPPLQKKLNPKVEVSLYPNLVHIPHIVGCVQLPLFGPQVPPPDMQPKVLPGVQLLRANVGLQGANDFLKNMYNVVRQYKS